MKCIVVVLAVAAILTISACKKKVAPAPPPPPPAVQAPTASLTANPAAIQQGQSSTLSWTTQNATEITLEGIGRVRPQRLAAGRRPPLQPHTVLPRKGPVERRKQPPASR